VKNPSARPEFVSLFQRQSLPYFGGTCRLLTGPDHFFQIYQMTSNQISPIYVQKRRVVIAVPYGYSHRDQLIGIIQSKFFELEISVVHQDISKLEVNEAEVEYDASAPPAAIAREIMSKDSRSVMEEVADALSKFSR
jgi:hypothetical protein